MTKLTNFSDMPDYHGIVKNKKTNIKNCYWNFELSF